MKRSQELIETDIAEYKGCLAQSEDMVKLWERMHEDNKNKLTKLEKEKWWGNDHSEIDNIEIHAESADESEGEFTPEQVALESVGEISLEEPETLRQRIQKQFDKRVEMLEYRKGILSYRDRGNHKMSAITYTVMDSVVYEGQTLIMATHDRLAAIKAANDVNIRYNDRVVYLEAWIDGKRAVVSSRDINGKPNFIKESTT